MEFLQATLFLDIFGTPALFWVVFLAIIAALLAFDLGMLHRSTRAIGARESFILYAGYVAIAFAFGAWVWWSRGSQAGLEFFTGYVIEQSLAMDNIFVIATIFGFLNVPRPYQHRVLFWGIIGAIAFRAVLIGVGSALVASFSWVLFIFGAFLLFTGVKMLHPSGTRPDLTDNPILKWMRRLFRLTDDYHGERFTVRLPEPGTGKVLLHLTPLAVALVMVEFVDLVFAIDSVPAVFAVTQDPFIVYTSNIFAILGLRALYFALAAAVHRFKYLQYALATVLMLVGVKIILVPLGIKIDTGLSLAATLGILGGGILYSLWKTRSDRPERTGPEPI